MSRRPRSTDQLRRLEWRMAKCVAVHRLHQMTGHASSSAISRMLKLAKADLEVFNRLKYFKCETCQRHKKPEPTPVVRPPSLYTFNCEITADCFECREALGYCFTVLSVIGVGTLFHDAWIVSGTGGNLSSKKCAEIFRDHWFSLFGPPKFLTVDRGLANRGRVASLMQSYVRCLHEVCWH